MRDRRATMTSWTMAAMLLLALTTPATVGAEELADETLRDEALRIYGLRCGVDPDSSGARRARTDWDLLVARGYDAGRLLSTAFAIPEECVYISFRTAILGIDRDLGREAPQAPDSPAPQLADLDRAAPERTASPTPNRADRLHRDATVELYLDHCEARRRDGQAEAIANREFEALVQDDDVDLDADDVHDAAERLGWVSCRGHSLRRAILDSEIRNLEQDRDGLLAAGTPIMILGYSSIAGGAIMMGGATSHSAGYLDGFGEALAGTLVMTLGVAITVGGSALFFAGIDRDVEAGELRRARDRSQASRRPSPTLHPGIGSLVVRF